MLLIMVCSFGTDGDGETLSRITRWKTRRVIDTMAIFATDRRLHPRYPDGGPHRPRSAAVGVSRVLDSVAPHAWNQGSDGADRAAGHRGADGAVEAIGAERDRLAGETKADRRRARKHHRRTGLHRDATVASMI